MRNPNPTHFNATIIRTDGLNVTRQGATWKEVALEVALATGFGIAENSPVFIASAANNDIRNVSQYTVGELRREFDL